MAISFRVDRVPPDYLKCALFLFGVVGDADVTGEVSTQPVGTMFLVGEPLGDTGKTCPWLVTARHVIDNTRAGERLYFRVPRNDGTVKAFFTPNDGWISDPATDTAFVRLGVLGFATDEIKSVPSALLASADLLTARGITHGDSTFAVGLETLHFGPVRDRPVLRFGRVASMSTGPITFPGREGFPRVTVPDAYLIESTAWPGQSGAPVFVQPPSELVLVSDTMQIQEFQPSLLGIVTGHLAGNTEVQLSPGLAAQGEARVYENRSLAIVTPITALLGAMDHPEHVTWREQEIERLKHPAVIEPPS